MSQNAWGRDMCYPSWHSACQAAGILLLMHLSARKSKTCHKGHGEKADGFCRKPVGELVGDQLLNQFKSHWVWLLLNQIPWTNNKTLNILNQQTFSASSRKIGGTKTAPGIRLARTLGGSDRPGAAAGGGPGRKNIMSGRDFFWSVGF